MVDVTLLQSASYIAAALGVILAALNYIVTSRREEKRSQQTLETRQAQMFMNIYQQATSKDFIQAWHKVYEDNTWKNYEKFKELWQDKDFREAFNVIGTYYEGLGVLVKEGLLSIKLVALLISGMTFAYWGRVQPIIGEARVAFNASRFLSESEYLYGELVRYIEVHPELRNEAHKSHNEL